ncbi:rRNA N6-adenosine-methyltransferase ZCCHC4 [Protopterus annectens]|uniref:rRNA N6-adenosine-methyltransferase ZCCHC4 n=1 Tax=Protopterus annectens TaxID=7888 RepID=UPI001CFB3915|nr:rRNA N6-adenosine-methyltransferase ZCCHC4 [Protopterus annectens]
MSDRLGIDVILSEDIDARAPKCPHGPTLLFTKICRGEEHEPGRRFYACSACRDRKDCNFFQWEEEKVSESRHLAREEYNKSRMPPFTHAEYRRRCHQYRELPLHKRKFCQDCQLLLLPSEWDVHCGHRVCGDIALTALRRPSQLLHPLKNKKSNAQYLFADRTCQFLLEVIIRLGFRRVLCVGTPRLHELIVSRASEGKEPCVRSLLLDIDFRYSQFYSEDEFVHYNMFNHYFFGGEAAREVCATFLHQNSGQEVIIVTDPPFGGLVEPLAYSFKKMSAMWKQSLQPEMQRSELPMFWIFPYFFEPRILQCFPEFCMLDYQVDYDNHALYKHGKMGRKQSPVRIFTNLPPKEIILPAEEGYRFCLLCERYVSSENRHCEICNSCTSKDGRRWRHCSICRKCVKPSWIHCDSCNRCILKSHSCGKTASGCFVCGSADHKRRECPKLHVSKKTKRVKQSCKKKPTQMAKEKGPISKTKAAIRKKMKRKKQLLTSYRKRRKEKA